MKMSFNDLMIKIFLFGIIGGVIAVIAIKVLNKDSDKEVMEEKHCYYVEGEIVKEAIIVKKRNDVQLLRKYFETKKIERLDQDEFITIVKIPVTEKVKVLKYYDDDFVLIEYRNSWYEKNKIENEYLEGYVLIEFIQTKPAHSNL